MLVYCWGRGEDGQLGLGDRNDQVSPRPIRSFNLVHDTLSDASSSLNVLYSSAIKQVVCGSGHTGILTKDGKLYTWGRGDDGRLGHSDNDWKLVPCLVQPLLQYKVTAVTCGSYHTAAVTSEGFLFTWGGGMYGKLGHGNETGYNSPKKVETVSDVIAVACGSRHTLCLCLDNSNINVNNALNNRRGLNMNGIFPTRHKVFAWGEKRNGVTGLGPSHRTGVQTLPAQIPTDYFTLPLSMTHNNFDNVVNEEQRLHQRLLMNAIMPPDAALNGVEEDVALNRLHNSSNDQVPFEVVKLVACGFHSALLTRNGDLFTWGDGKFGRLGRGGETDDHYPKIIPRESFRGEPVVDISCGGFHSAAITESGKLFIWGGGEHGQLGFGNRNNVYFPELLHSQTFIDGLNREFGGGNSGNDSVGQIMNAPVTNTAASVAEREHDNNTSVNNNNANSNSSMNNMNNHRSLFSDCSVKALQVVCGWSHTTCLVKLQKEKNSVLVSNNYTSRRGSSSSKSLNMNLVFSWGNGDHGKLGHGNQQTEQRPKVVVDLYGKNVIRLASYNEHTVALSDPQDITNKLPVARSTSQVTSTLVEDVSAIRKDTTFTDVTFEIDGREIKAHKIILSARSAHFRAMFEGKFNFRESSESRIIINSREHETLGPKVSYPVFKAMITYLYTDDLTGLDELEQEIFDENSINSLKSKSSNQEFDIKIEPRSWENDSDPDLGSTTGVRSSENITAENNNVKENKLRQGKSSRILVDLFGTADMYGLDRLKHLCENRIRNVLDNTNASLFLKAADEVNCLELREQLIQYVVSNFESISKTESFECLEKEVIVEILKLR